MLKQYILTRRKVRYIFWITKHLGVFFYKLHKSYTKVTLGNFLFLIYVTKYHKSVTQRYNLFLNCILKSR